MNCPSLHFFSSLSQCCQVFSRLCSKWKLSWEFTPTSQKQLFVSVTFESVLWLHHTQIPKLCSEFRVIDVGFIMALLRRDYSCWHQLIIQELVLETKLSTLRSVCLNDRFSRFQQRFTSFTFDWKIRLSFWHQIIYSHSQDCTRLPWESLTLMVISLTLINGSHHW